MEKIDRLHALVYEQLAAEDEVTIAERELSAAKRRLSRLADYVIPDVMEEMNLTEYKTSDGLTVKLKQSIRAHISEFNRPTAFAWLEEHENDAMIKTVLTVEVPALLSDFENVEEIQAALKTVCDNLPSTEAQSVHSSTLSAFVKEKLVEGEEIPLDTFGVFRQVSSVVKPSK